MPTEPSSGYLVGLGRAAKLADVSVRTLRRRIADGTLPAVRVGPHFKVRKADVDALAVPVSIEGKSA